MAETRRERTAAHLSTDSHAVEIAVAWVLRRVGFGATVADLERAADVGIDAFLDELFDPDGFGVPDDGDPWAELDVPLIVESPRDVVPAIAAWFDRFRFAGGCRRAVPSARCSSCSWPCRS